MIGIIIVKSGNLKSGMQKKEKTAMNDSGLTNQLSHLPECIRWNWHLFHN